MRRSEFAANLALSETVLACHGWHVGRHALGPVRKPRHVQPGYLVRVLRALGLA
jgi:hypothetical protein